MEVPMPEWADDESQEKIVSAVEVQEELDELFTGSSRRC